MKIIEKNYNFTSTLAKRTTTTTIILHHAASSSCSADDVHRWHLARGWSGIGYHFFIRKNGEVYRGRPENTVGAHAKGHNNYSLGICVEGNYQNEQMPQVQQQAVSELIVYLKNKYGNLRVIRHKDVGNTSCPGNNFPYQNIIKGKISSSTPAYKIGNTYTLQVELKVRTGAGTNYSAKKHSQLTTDGKKHDSDKDGALDKGTKVTCLAVKNNGSDIWIKSPSGWLAAYYKGNIYIN